MLQIWIAGCLVIGLFAEVDGEADLLKGKWKIVNERVDKLGMVIVWEFTSTEVIVRNETTGEEVSRTRYTIDTTKNPHWITLDVDDSPTVDTGDQRLGIFRILEGELQLKQEITDGGERPDKFGERYSRFRRFPQNQRAEHVGDGKPAKKKSVSS